MVLCFDEAYHWSRRDLCTGGCQVGLASAFGGQTVYQFWDNYGAMDALIKGSSSNSDIRELLLCFEKLECNGSHWFWFSRVPSASSCADDPTRVRHVLGSFLQGAIRDRCMCRITGLELSDFVGSAWFWKVGLDDVFRPHCSWKKCCVLEMFPFEMWLEEDTVFYVSMFDAPF